MALRDHRLAGLVLFAGLAVLHTWPLASNPAGLSRLDNADTALNTWTVAWVAHQIVRDPRTLFDAPMFHPEPLALAYSEPLLFQGLVAVPLAAAGLSPAHVYNLLVLAGFALSGWSMFLLVRRWTGDAAAGVTAGMAFAFNAHLLTRLPHLQALHVQFVPLLLLALDTLVRRTRPRDGALVGLALALVALTSIYLFVFASYATAAALLIRVGEWRVRAWKLAAALGAGAAVAAAVAGPALYPYYLLHASEGVGRVVADAALYSASWGDYLETAGRLHLALWAEPFYRGRTALFPGVVVTLLAVAGLATARGDAAPRARMMAAVGLLGLLFSFGPGLPGYAWLHETAPLLAAVRATSRWAFLLLTALAVLAGFGVTWLRRSLAARWATRAACIAVPLLVTVEALRAPMGFTPTPSTSRVHDRLAQIAPAAIAIFPLHPAGVFHRNAPYLVDATRHFRPLVNGYSGFAPARWARLADELQAFPSADSLARLREVGVTHVLVYTDRFARAGELRGHTDFELVARDEELALYRLLPRPVSGRPPPTR